MQNCSPGQLLSNKSRRRGLKHVRSNELHGKTADPGDRGTDIVACNKNARTGKIDGPDYEVTSLGSLVSGIWGGERIKGIQILVSESHTKQEDYRAKVMGRGSIIEDLDRDIRRGDLFV